MIQEMVQAAAGDVATREAAFRMGARALSPLHLLLRKCCA